MDVPDEAEIEAHVAQTLSGGPQAAAAAMSDERLEEALAEWQAMLATAQPFMRSAILGNISLFAAELQRREQKK